MHGVVPSALVHADGVARLPRLGGMARPGGVAIVSERFWAFASTDGTVREGTMPSPPAFVSRLPLLRGLLRLGASLSPLFRSSGAASRRERIVLAGALLLPLVSVFLPDRLELPGAIAATAIVIALLFRGSALRLHGAEHRAIAAAEGRSLVAAWAGSARPSRFSDRCGTNFAALALPITAAVQLLWPLQAAFYTPFAVLPLSLALTMELWLAVQSPAGRRLRALLWPGLALQRLTTREPAVAETRVALAAVASVLRRELAQPAP